MWFGFFYSLCDLKYFVRQSHKCMWFKKFSRIYFVYSSMSEDAKFPESIQVQICVMDSYYMKFKSWILKVFYD